MRLWGPLVFWLAAMFFFSSLHRTPIPQSKYISWDKLVHLTEYTIMGYLAARALFFSGFRRISRDYLWIAIFFGLLFGISDEIHQFYVPGRSSSPWDVLADLAGVIVGALVFRWMLRRGRFKTLLPFDKSFNK
jgi:VanZ family protein